MSAITLGADPEFFVMDANENILSAEGMIGGTKQEPIALESTGYFGQEDNVLAEYNIPYCIDAYDFCKRVKHGRELMMQHIYARTGNDALRVSMHCESIVLAEFLQTEASAQFGCAPDLNAYANGAVHPAIDPKELEEGAGQWRFAGGHVHIGYESKIPHFVVAMLGDVFLSLPFVGVDWQDKRRKLYGQPGRYRVTPYGIEYRTLSNFWIHSDHMIAQVAQNAMHLGRVVQETDPNQLKDQFQQIPWKDVTGVIINNDKNLARELMAHINEIMGFGGHIRHDYF